MYTFTPFPKIQIPSATPSSSKFPAPHESVSSLPIPQPDQKRTHSIGGGVYTQALSPPFTLQASSSTRYRPLAVHHPGHVQDPLVHLWQPAATWTVLLLLLPLWRTARTEVWPFNLFNGCIVTRPNEQGSGGDIRRRQVFMSGPPLPFFPPSVGGREREREEGGEKRRWPVGSLMKSTIV